MDSPTKQEEDRIGTHIMRQLGRCGAVGYPEYDGGERWRTFCSLPVDHRGDHGRAEATITHRWSD